MKTRYKAFTSKKQFGVEFEISNTLQLARLTEVVTEASPDRKVIAQDGWAQTDDGNNYWHIKRDSTCGPEGKTKDISLYGYEVASYVGKGIKDVLQMGKMAHNLKKSGAVINDHCGIHIHASADKMTPEQIGVIMAYWVKIERTMFESCPPTRRKNKYCRSLRRRVPVNSKLTSKEFWDKIKPENLNVHENEDKKVSINTVGYAQSQANYGGKNTIELRMPEASLDRKDVVNWIRLYLNFITTTEKAEMPLSRRVAGVKDTLQILGLHGVQNFFVLSKGLHNTKMWFLNRIIRYSENPRLVKEAIKLRKDSLL